MRAESGSGWDDTMSNYSSIFGITCSPTTVSKPCHKLDNTSCEAVANYGIAVNYSALLFSVNIRDETKLPALSITILIKNIDRLASRSLDEVLQLLDGRLLHRIVQPSVAPQRGERGEPGELVVRRVAVIVVAAVRRPHIVGNGHAVGVEATKGPSRGQHSGDDVRCALAVVVESLARDLLLRRPGALAELLDQRDRVGHGVGRRLVVEFALVLVRVELATHDVHGVPVVFQHRLSVVSAPVEVPLRELLHVP